MPAKPAQSPTLYWNPDATPQPLQPMLRALAADYRLVDQPRRGAIPLRFNPAGPQGQVSIQWRNDAAEISYDQPSRALRGVGSLLAGLGYLAAKAQPLTEATTFTNFGIMLDVSRNAVMTVSHVKRWLRQLALLGYNMLMLYTEDTYEITGEPAFGYQRGRYSREELQEIDRYAAGLGMEVIGCIQTLGHLDQILKWPAYKAVKDTSSVMLVDESATYELIEKMVMTVSDSFGSRRIHIGMDEAHDLGRGRFMDRFGYERAFDIFNRHLAKVVEICERHGLKPMIWSDMYFRMGSQTGEYYDDDATIPPDVKAAIPPAAELVYWDYYHDDAAVYADFIERHRELDKEPLMASGVWTWSRLWYDARTTRNTVFPCITASREKHLQEFFLTLWGDDGAYCEFDSALAGLAYGAEAAYNGETLKEAHLQKRFAAICGADYKSVEDMSELTEHGSAAILWDDPLLGIAWNEMSGSDSRHWPNVLRAYQRLLKRMQPHAKTTQPVDLAHGVKLLQCLVAKVDLGIKLRRAYAKRDRTGLVEVRQAVPSVIRSVDQLLASFRRQWHRRNKPQGFEVIQIRLAGLRERYRELAQRLDDLAAGKIECIPELDEAAGVSKANATWRNLASASTIL